MSDKHYPNSGALFRNEKQRDNRDPYYTGRAEVDGKQYWLSAWIKESTKGKFMSISFNPQDGVKQVRKAVEQPDPQDDDVPF